jgi:transcriptional regulator with XRE-family HTH domain
MAGTGRGRRYDLDFMQRQLARGRERGWSLFRLARETGISLPTLSRWRRRLDGATRPADFIEVVSTRPALGLGGGGISLEIELKGGHRVALVGGVDGATIERVLSLLARTC